VAVQPLPLGGGLVLGELLAEGVLLGGGLDGGGLLPWLTVTLSLPLPPPQVSVARIW